MVVREREVKAPRIKGQIYKHVQDLGNVVIEFEKGMFYQFKRMLPPKENSDIEMFHVIDSFRHREFFLYKSRGTIFASLGESILLVQYLQTIKIRVIFKW